MSILKPRRKTRQVMIGDVAVGGDAPEPRLADRE